MADRRRQEIEEKKAKLAELIRARDERKALLAQAESGAGPSQPPQVTSRKDVNDFVDSILGRPTTPATGRTTPAPAVARTTSYGESKTPGDSVPPTPSGRQSRLSNASTSGKDKSVGVGIGAGGEDSGVGRALQPGIDLRSGAVSPAVDYIDHSTELYELPAKAKPPPITYSKSTQTASISTSTSTSDLPEDDELRNGRGEGSGSGRETEEDMRRRIIEELETERKKVEKEIEDLKDREESLNELSVEQKQAILSAPDFSVFIEESTRIVQRALSDGYDYIRDYTVGLDGAFDDSEDQKVKLFCTFSDERWTHGRSVTALDWSWKFPELVAAAYNKNSGSPNDPDGIVAVWNLHLQERPEFIFHSPLSLPKPSDILSLSFSPYHPTLVFGGSYSGQVLLWDTRAKHLPVLKTPLSASGHTYPIYGMKMVGTQNANSLISASTDGMVCSWLADMLAQPQESLMLTMPNHSKTDEVSITALDFPYSETSTFWVGTEEGSVYQANRYDQPSRKAGISANIEDVYRGHTGPVTGINFHPSSGNIDFGDLFLTSGVDWSVKLWRSKGSNTSKPRGSGQKIDPHGRGNSGQDKTKDGSIATAGQSPLCSFDDYGDYVFDVKWHPQHPALFASVDGTGRMDVWNLIQNTEVPIISTPVSNRALNKVAFDRTQQSRKVATAGADGKIYVHDLAEKLVVPRDVDWVELQRVVTALAGHSAA